MHHGIGHLSRGLLCAAAATLFLAACGGKDDAKQSAPPPRDPNLPLFVVSTGLSTPESVLWDATRRVWYVSNINGSPLAKDDNGYIIRLGANGEQLDSVPFINGADDDITLNAPKGLALRADTLWVADIDMVRGFDVTSGMAVASIDLRPLRATFLNDIAVGPEGSLYITDSGISFSAEGAVTHPGLSRVFEIRDRTARQAVVLPRQSAANGITWWPARNAWIIVGFNTTSIFSWVPGAKEATVIGEGPGGADGVVVMADGGIVFTSWADSTVSLLYEGHATGMRRAMNAPADLGYDPLRGILAVPLFNDNQVVFWSVTTSPTSSAPALRR